MKLLKESLKRGIITENPTFVLVLGMCPTLAVTTTIANGIGMGLSATVVLMLSNFFISLLRNFIPQKVRIAAYIVVVASFVTIVQMLLQAYFPDLYKSLGIFIPLIVVNCIILARAEAYASKNGPFASLLDGLGMGLGFTLALVAMATVREVFGAASFAGIAIPMLEPYKIEVLVKAPGGMMVYGFLIALVYVITSGKAPLKKSFSCAGCPHASSCHTACTEISAAAETEKGDAQ